MDLRVRSRDGDGVLTPIRTAYMPLGNYFAFNIAVLLNNGDGTFRGSSYYGAGNRPRSVFAGDLDGDGDADMITTNYGAANISVLVNRSND